MATNDDETTTEWTRDTQKRALLVWISFLVAGAMGVVFFAFIDPIIVVDAVALPGVESREAGYAMGFFFFWAGCALCGWLCLRLARRKRNWPQPVGPKSGT